MHNLRTDSFKYSIHLKFVMIIQAAPNVNLNAVLNKLKINGLRKSQFLIWCDIVKLLLLLSFELSNDPSVIFL